MAKVERGKRQYALFAGLEANSLGDKYARNLATTPEVMDASWNVATFSFDNAKNTVTAYLNGGATEYWIENHEKHPFFQWPYKA